MTAMPQQSATPSAPGLPLARAGGASLPAVALRDPLLVRRWAQVLGLAVLCWPLMVWTEFQPYTAFTARSLHATGAFLRQFFPPRTDAEFLALVAAAAWRSVAMATAGLCLAGLLAVPLALAATARLSVSGLASRMGPGPLAVRAALRGLLVLLRSVPELVWALLLVRVVGLGPTAGVLAIGIAYGGMLGKVYAEILESADPAPTLALLRLGCGRLQAFCFGALPQCASELASYTVYRWECAIRSSVVLGFVGAGGLGQALDNATKMYAGAEVSLILGVFMALVAVSDGLSALLRRALR